MIDGIHVLSSVDIYKYQGPATIVFIASAIMGFIFLLIFEVSRYTNNDKITICGAVGIICILVAMSIVCYAETHKNTFDHTEYEVVFQEDLSMTEFISKYDVIDKHGSVYTIVEKDKEE